RGIVVPGQEAHPILRGIRSGDIWAPTDVYQVRVPLPGDAQPLILGQVLEGMHATDAAAAGKQNDPMMPVAWVKTDARRVFTTTMGSAQDLLNAPLRRLLVNACYWALKMESRIDPRSSVELVGPYTPLPFRFGGHAPGVKVSDLRP